MRTGSEVDVAVVGAGVMGLAAARELARAGRDVLVLEQLRVGHDRGSSHGSSRVFRLSYDEAEWVRLAAEALELWRRLEEEAAEPLLVASGALDLGRHQAALTTAMDECGVAYELLDARDVAGRFPIAVDAEPVVLQPDGGVCWASRAIDALRRSVERHGGRVAEGTRVTALEPRDEGVRVDTAGGRFDARVALVTAGAWARPLLAKAGIELPVKVTRETAAYFELDDARSVPSLGDWRFPDRAEWSLARTGPTYALTAGAGLLKAGLHDAGPEADPDENGAPDEAAVRYLTTWVERTFAPARPSLKRAETCLYTTTPDACFVLERHGSVVVGSPCSGHGFKFAPAIGRRLAELAG